MQALLDGEMDRYTIEKRYLHADGHEVPIELSVSLLHDDRGEPLHFISQIQDISDGRRAEEERDRFIAELLRSNTELERFAMVASHDLLSPLTTVRTILLVIANLAGDEPRRGPRRPAGARRQQRRPAARAAAIRWTADLPSSQDVYAHGTFGLGWRSRRP